MTEIPRYKSEYGINLEKTSKLDETYFDINFHNGEFLIMDSSTLANDNPFKELETSSTPNFKDIINKIASYSEPTSDKTKAMNSFGKNIPNIYLYKKKDSSELYSKLDINNEKDSREYSNYLRSFIIYDRCLEFINSLNDSVLFKEELLKVYSKNKKIIITGTPLYGPSRFGLILWDIIANLANIKNDYLSLLKTSYNIKFNYKPDLNFDDVQKTINTGKIPFAGRTSFKKSSSFSKKGVPLGSNIASQAASIAVKIFKKNINSDIIIVKRLERETNEVLDRILNGYDPSDDEIIRLFNKLNELSRTITKIMEFIEANDEIKATFDSDLPYLKTFLIETNQNILAISDVYSDLVSSTPVKNLAFNIPPPSTFEARRKIFESASHKESPVERFRRISKVVPKYLDGLEVFKRK